MKARSSGWGCRGLGKLRVEVQDVDSGHVGLGVRVWGVGKKFAE